MTRPVIFVDITAENPHHRRVDKSTVAAQIVNALRKEGITVEYRSADRRMEEMLSALVTQGQVSSKLGEGLPTGLLQIGNNPPAELDEEAVVIVRDETGIPRGEVLAEEVRNRLRPLVADLEKHRKAVEDAQRVLTDATHDLFHTYREAESMHAKVDALAALPAVRKLGTRP